MSLKFHNGFIIKNITIEGLKKEIENHNFQEKANEIGLNSLSNAYLNYIDMSNGVSNDSIWHTLKKVREEELKIKDFISEKRFDLSSELLFKVVDNDILFFVESYNQELADNILKDLKADSFMYFDEMKKPVNVPEKDWLHRKKIWSETKPLYQDFQRIKITENEPGFFDLFSYKDINKSILKNREKRFVNYNIQSYIHAILFEYTDNIEGSMLIKLNADIKSGFYDEEKEVIKEIFKKNKQELTEENFKYLKPLPYDISQDKSLQSLTETTKKKLAQRSYIKNVDFSVPAPKRKKNGYVPF